MSIGNRRINLKKLGLIMVLSVGVAVFTSACGSSTNKNASEQSNPSVQSQETQQNAEATSSQDPSKNSAAQNSDAAANSQANAQDNDVPKGLVLHGDDSKSKSDDKSEKATISKAEYDKIKNDMTYEEVSKIIGGPGELIAEFGKKGDPTYCAVYQYSEDAPSKGSVSFTFQNGKLNAKAKG